MEQTDHLETYLQKITELQSDWQQPNFLPLDELKKIAHDMGVSEQQWENMQAQARNYLQQGLQFNQLENWTDAISSLEQALSINPHLNQARTALATAHMNRNQDDDLGIATQIAQAALDYDSSDKQAIQVKSKISQQKKFNLRSSTSQRKTRKFIIAIIATAILFVVISMHYLLRNAIVEQEENVNTAWAQVENAYQRRADLIPQLVEVVKKGSAYERDLLKSLVQAQANAVQAKTDLNTDDSFKAYEAAQQQVQHHLHQFMSSLQQIPELKSMEQFLTLQAQIEGAENRISHTKYKFNEHVGQYNKLCRRFPYSIYGFEPKNYAETSKKAQEMPKIDL